MNFTGKTEKNHEEPKPSTPAGTQYAPSICHKLYVLEPTCSVVIRDGQHIVAFSYVYSVQVCTN
jgi:hypothetical protein